MDVWLSNIMVKVTKVSATTMTVSLFPVQFHWENKKILGKVESNFLHILSLPSIQPNGKKKFFLPLSLRPMMLEVFKQLSTTKLSGFD